MTARIFQFHRKPSSWRPIVGEHAYALGQSVMVERLENGKALISGTYWGGAPWTRWVLIERLQPCPFTAMEQVMSGSEEL